VLLLVGTIPAAIGWLLALVDHTRFFEIGLAGMLLGHGVAGLLIFRGGKVHPDREALAWRLIGLALMLAGLGVAATGVLASIGILPAFGPHDLIFLSVYATVIVGLLIMPHTGGGVQSQIRVLLDGAIGALAVSILVTVFFLPGIRLHLATATSWERFAGVGYPLLDSLMVVVVMIVTIRRSAWRFDIRVVALGLAFCLQALADLRFLSSGVGASLTEAQPDFRFFLAAVLLELLAASQIRKRMKPKEYADRRQPLWAMIAPYGAMMVALIVVVRQTWVSDVPSNIVILLVMGLTTVAMVVLRQIVALREYRALVSQQREGLVASVSHELRTPLTAMVGFLEVLDDKTIELGAAERKELISIVRQQSTYMSRIVADLLLLARESQVLAEADVAVSDLVADTIKAVGRYDVRLATDITPGLTATVDKDRMRQALNNLVVNALRYGNGNVLIKAFGSSSDLIIEVHDDGPGVPRKFELAIWDQFERGANRLNAATPGSGIGLSVVDVVVRRHGGTATYKRSTILGGACFSMILPERIRSGEAQTAQIRSAASHLAV
jgi:signal transduction histidine kinase